MKEIVEVLKPFDEVTLVPHEKGLQVLALDPSHVYLCKLVIDKSKVMKVEVNKDEKVGLYPEVVEKLLKRVPVDSKATLEVTEGLGVLNVEGRGSRLVRFLVPAPGEVKDVNIPYDAEAEVDARSLYQTVADMKGLYDDVQVIISKGMVFVRGVGGKIVTDGIYRFGETVSVTASDEEVRSTFQIKFLLDILKAIKGLGIIKVGLSTDKPLVIKAQTVFGSLNYYLAPKVGEG